MSRWGEVIVLALAVLWLALLLFVLNGDIGSAYALQKANQDQARAEQRIVALQTEVASLRTPVTCGTYVIHC